MARITASPIQRAAEEGWRAIRTLNLYRWLLAVGLATVLATGVGTRLFDVHWPVLFIGGTASYLLLCLPATFATYKRIPGLEVQVYLTTGTDIAFVTALLLASSGVDNGLGMLLLAPVAGASMLVPRRMAALLAAAASISLLLEESWRQLVYAGDAGEFVQTGILGVLLFISAIGANGLAARARSSAELAASRKSELDDLSVLNERIIQQMQIGLLVVDENRRIRLYNHAAQGMLGIGANATGEQLKQAAPALALALQAWTVSPNLNSEPFAAAGHLLTPYFNRLGHGLDAPVLVFLEDARRVNEQAQQMKLAALGRLTASIAHEIRNPLSAISHAGQLLDEAGGIGDDERRLLGIVHRHTKRIDGIVKSVLGLSRRPQSMPQILHPASWLPQVIADYSQGRDNAPRIELNDIPPEFEIQADPSHLRQILHNLWENVERHARVPDQPLVITLGSGSTANGDPYLEVADNGPGIDKAARERLMEPFFTTTNDGTGLGLYIASELCALNFARIDYIDRDAPGACFRITFAPPSQQRSATVSASYTVASQPADG